MTFALSLFTTILSRIERLAMPSPVVVGLTPELGSRGGRKRQVTGVESGRYELHTPVKLIARA